MAAVTNPSESIVAVDVHAHYGRWYGDGESELVSRFCSGDAQAVVDRATLANTACTIVSPLAGLMPRGQADAYPANEHAAREVERLPGLLHWVIVHPLQPRTYEQARWMLQRPKCAGIKIHPELHEYLIQEHGQALFEFAAEMSAVVLAHSGDERSWPADLVHWSDQFPEVRLILAHLGNGGKASGPPDLQVRAVQSSRHGNVWTDTSSSRSVLPGLIEWAVDEIGPERILYGTDTPLYFAPVQRRRIDAAAISDHAKRLILRENAIRLLNLTDDVQSRRPMG